MAVTGRQAVAVIDLDHVAVSTLISRPDDGPVRRSDDVIAALAVDVHSGMKFVSTATEGVTPEAELIVDLAKVRPHGRHICGVRVLEDHGDLAVDLGVLAGDVR